MKPNRSVSVNRMPRLSCGPIFGKHSTHLARSRPLGRELQASSGRATHGRPSRRAAEGGPRPRAWPRQGRPSRRAQQTGPARSSASRLVPAGCRAPSREAGTTAWMRTGTRPPRLRRSRSPLLRPRVWRGRRVGRRAQQVGGRSRRGRLEAAPRRNRALSCLCPRNCSRRTPRP